MVHGNTDYILKTIFFHISDMLDWQGQSIDKKISKGEVDTESGTFHQDREKNEDKGYFSLL